MERRMHQHPTTPNPDPPTPETPVAAQPVADKPPARARRRAAAWLLIALGMLLLAVIVELNAFYNFRRPVVIVERVASWLRLPAAQVKWRFISYAAVQRDHQILKRYSTYQAEQQPSLFRVPADTAIDQIVIERLLRNAMTEELARQRKLTVTPTEINDDFSKRTAGIPAATLQEQLQQQFGLTVSTYQQLIVRPFLLRQKLEAAIAFDDSVNPGLTTRAERVAAAVKDSPEPFEKLVQQYSEDSESAQQGGDLGYRREDELSAPVLEAFKQLKPGERSGLVRSAEGYHIFELLESVPSDETGKLVFHPSHILIRAKSVDAWVGEQLALSRVSIFLPQYSWERENARVGVLVSS